MGRVVMERLEFVALALFPEVTPFEAAKVFFPGFGPLAVEQVTGATQVVFGQGLERDVYFRGIGIAAGGSPGVFCDHSLHLRIGLGACGAIPVGAGLLAEGTLRVRGAARLLFGLSRAHGLPGSKDETGEQGNGHCARGGERKLVPADQSAEAIGGARWPGDYRFIGQVALNVGRERIGRFVTARAVFLQTLHHHPVQVAAHEMHEFGRLGMAGACDRGQLGLSQRVQARRGPRRLLVAQRAADAIQAGAG
jgi:hypothetical protein